MLLDTFRTMVGIHIRDFCSLYILACKRHTKMAIEIMKNWKKCSIEMNWMQMYSYLVYIPEWRPNIPEYFEMLPIGRVFLDYSLDFPHLTIVRLCIWIEFSNQNRCCSVASHIWPVEHNDNALFDHHTMVFRLDRLLYLHENHLSRWWTPNSIPLRLRVVRVELS